MGGQVDTAADLRDWARGMYGMEAAVELLVRFAGGRFARAGQPWIRRKPNGGIWVDSDEILASTGGLSGGERRVMLVVASLLDDTIEMSLGDLFGAIDRDALELVLAALAHAGASHRHSGIAYSDDGTASLIRLHRLYDWPADTGDDL